MAELVLRNLLRLPLVLPFLALPSREQLPLVGNLHMLLVLVADSLRLVAVELVRLPLVAVVHKLLVELAAEPLLLVQLVVVELAVELVRLPLVAVVHKLLVELAAEPLLLVQLVVVELAVELVRLPLVAVAAAEFLLLDCFVDYLVVIDHWGLLDQS